MVNVELLVQASDYRVLSTLPISPNYLRCPRAKLCIGTVYKQVVWTNARALLCQRKACWFAEPADDVVSLNSSTDGRNNPRAEYLGDLSCLRKRDFRSRLYERSESDERDCRRSRHAAKVGRHRSSDGQTKSGRSLPTDSFQFVEDVPLRHYAPNHASVETSSNL